MIKAIIFDMDGLIIDSELLQSMAFKEVLKRRGIRVHKKIVQTIGVRAIDNWKMLKDKYGLENDVNTLTDERSKIYIDLLKENVKAMRGLYELIDLLKEHNYKIAIASSSALKHIHIVLQKLDLKGKFDVIVSGDQVKKGKPDPEIYLTAAKLLGIPPEESVVLEDASTGIDAAKRANMICIAVPNRYTKIGDLSKADLIVSSLADPKLTRFIFSRF